MSRKHRLAVQSDDQIITEESKPNFLVGMFRFYGSALSGAKNKLGSMMRKKEGSGERSSYDNTGYEG